MNKNTIIKIVLDIIMTILFILELNLNIIGFDLHEIIGLFFGLIIFIHFILNKNWIKMIFKNKNKNKKMKILILINTLLFVAFALMIITGIIISKFIFNFNINNYKLISLLHKISAYVCGIIILTHLLMHFRYLKNILLKIFKKNDLSILNKLLLRGSIILLGVLILYVLFISVFYKKQEVIYIDQQYNEDSIKKEDNKSDDELDNDENNSKDNIREPESIEPKPSLQEFLSKLFCNGCGRHCPLSSPRCMTGKQNAEVATVEYNEQYN